MTDRLTAVQRTLALMALTRLHKCTMQSRGCTYGAMGVRNNRVALAGILVQIMIPGYRLLLDDTFRGISNMAMTCVLCIIMTVTMNGKL